MCYRRLPNTIRQYKAEAKGLMQQFDWVVVRVFEVGDGENATPVVTR